MLMMLLALQAQLPPAVPETKPACVLLEPAVAAEDGSSLPAEIQAMCGEQAVTLGEAKEHRSAYHPASRSLLVEAMGMAGKHVLLVSLDATGTPHVDDVTRELARLSGRYAEAGLADVVVDMEGFAATGILSVPITLFPAPDFSKFPTRTSAAGKKTTVPASRVTASLGGAATLDLKPYAARVADTASAQLKNPINTRVVTPAH